jgi:membrane protein implicated in regulation of membrane protease activity
MYWASGIWWIAVGALLIAELATGTFYLLMVACGCVAAGLVRLAGGSIEVQWAVAAVVAGLAVWLLHRSPYGRRMRIDAARNSDVNLDIGGTLEVEAWHDRRARANYRGTQWDVELAEGELEHAGRFEIIEMRGSHLVVRACSTSVPSVF